MSEIISQLIDDVVRAWNAHDVDRALKFYAPDYEEEDVAQADRQSGLEGIRRTMAYYLQAFPDLQLTVDDTIVEGCHVAVVWTLNGTHRGTLMNIPPTTRAVSVRGASVLTIENGKIKRALRIWDLAGLLRSIGLLPEL